MEEWFGQETLLVIDGDDAELKTSARGILEREWSGDGIADTLRSAHAAYASVVVGSVNVQANNLFVLEENGRRTRADRWLAAHSAADVQQLRPEQWSPNAALRPVYQEYMLQSAAFVGGPSEVGCWLCGGVSAPRRCHPALLVRDSAAGPQRAFHRAAEACGWTPQPALTGDAAVAAGADNLLRGNGGQIGRPGPRR